MEIFKTPSDRKHKTSENLKARRLQLRKEKHALKRNYRDQHRHGIHDEEAARDSDPLAFRVEEAARLIGVSRATLYVLISTGDLATIKIRKRRLVPREALLKLLAVGTD